jgi:hypothetical protein
MADATITISSGSQAASWTIPDETVQRLVPMIREIYRPHHPGSNPNLLQQFAAGLRATIRRDLRRYDRSQWRFEVPDLGGDPESK